MLRIGVGVLIGLLIGATGAGANEFGKHLFWDQTHPPPRYGPRDAARAAVRDFLVPLVRPDSQPVETRVRRCRPAGRWHACAVVVAGTTACRGILRVQVHGADYAAWMPRMRCR